MQFNALVFTAVMAVLANAELSGTGVVFAAGGCSGSGNSIDFSTTTGPPFCAQFPAGAVSLELATITPGCTGMSSRLALVIAVRNRGRSQC